jgi:DNA (cytosine-5)-methyltransferase 1
MKKINSKSEILNSVDLFCGGGVGSLGQHNAGIKGVLAIDNWKVAQEVFEQNFKDEKQVEFLNTDIFALTAEEILERTGLKAGELFLMTATAPCQGFSIAGKKNPFDIRNALFLHSQELIAKVKPKFFLMENVPGMTMPPMTPIFNEVKYRFQTVLKDYNVDCKKLNALFFGANQARERVIYIGVRKDINIKPPYPEPDIAGALKRKISYVLPDIDGIYAGQSKKLVKLPDSYLMTVTAGECFQIMDKGTLRSATTEELRTIAGLPDWFSFEGISAHDIHKIIGNAVPVQFMESLTRAIKDAYLNGTQSHAA